MKYELLEAELLKRQDAIKKTADFIGISEDKLISKLRGELPLTAYDANMICSINNITQYKDRIKFFYPCYPKYGINKRKEESINT